MPLAHPNGVGTPAKRSASPDRLLLAQALLLLLCLLPLGNAQAARVGQGAPALSARTLDGAEFDLAQELGNVVIVNFWATWCAPCRQEMPALEAYFQAHQAQGLRLIAISMDEPADAARVREVMSRFSFTAVLAAEARYRGYGRIWRMPMTFVIDRRGVLRVDGTQKDPRVDLPWLERWVSPLLQSGPVAPAAPSHSPQKL